LIEGFTNDRVVSVPLDQPTNRRVIGIAMAPPRLAAIKGALVGKLINGLITNESMAKALLN
jgi:DNA-binding transcriptional regulator LsrR (DeoR family)